MNTQMLEKPTRTEWLAKAETGDTNGNALIRRRALECLGMCMIGDGALAVVQPDRHVALWLRGPEWWQAMLLPFIERPQLTRCVGAAEVAIGFWLASRQTPPANEGLDR